MDQVSGSPSWLCSTSDLLKQSMRGLGLGACIFTKPTESMTQLVQHPLLFMDHSAWNSWRLLSALGGGKGKLAKGTACTRPGNLRGPLGKWWECGLRGGAGGRQRGQGYEGPDPVFLWAPDALLEV